MPVMLTATAKTGRRSDIPYIGIHLVVISNGGYYIYTTKPSRVLIPGYYLKVYIQIGGSSGPLK